MFRCMLDRALIDDYTYFIFKIIYTMLDPDDARKKIRNGSRPGLRKIICRYCGPNKEKINMQSYSNHLKIIHGDSSGDKRVYGEAKINFFLKVRSQEDSIQKCTKFWKYHVGVCSITL